MKVVQNDGAVLQQSAEINGVRQPVWVHALSAGFGTLVLPHVTSLIPPEELVSTVSTLKCDFNNVACVLMAGIDPNLFATKIDFILKESVAERFAPAHALLDAGMKLTWLQNEVHNNIEQRQAAFRLKDGGIIHPMTAFFMDHGLTVSDMVLVLSKMKKAGYPIDYGDPIKKIVASNVLVTKNKVDTKAVQILKILIESGCTVPDGTLDYLATKVDEATIAEIKKSMMVGTINSAGKENPAQSSSEVVRRVRSITL